MTQGSAPLGTAPVLPRLRSAASPSAARGRSHAARGVACGSLANPALANPGSMPPLTGRGA